MAIYIVIGKIVDCTEFRLDKSKWELGITHLLSILIAYIKANTWRISLCLCSVCIVAEEADNLFILSLISDNEFK